MEYTMTKTGRTGVHMYILYSDFLPSGSFQSKKQAIAAARKITSRFVYVRDMANDGHVVWQKRIVKS